ncbi:MAG: CehA/McbA family metallohydrolase [Pseudomonadota bacterium]
MTSPRILLAVSLALASCSTTGGGTHDTSQDIPAPDVVGDETGAIDVAADGAPDTDVELPAAKRAFVVTSEDDLLQGREATGRPGDLRIENEHLVAIIGAADHHMWGPFGGGILDLAVQGGEDRFQEAFSTAGFLRAVRAETVEVLADGSDGDAVIRVHGTDGAIPLVDLVAQTVPVGLDVTVDYILPEGSPCLEICTTATNPTDGNVMVALGDGVIWSETGRVFGPGAGYDPTGLLAQGPLGYIGADQPGLTHLLTPLGGASVSVALLEKELSLLSYEMRSLAPGETAEVRRCLYASAGRSLVPLAIHWEAKGQGTVPVSGTVQVATPGYDLEQAWVEVYRDDGFLGSVSPDTEGSFAFVAPPGAYRGVLMGEGLAESELLWTVATGEPVEGLVFQPAAPCRIDAVVTGSGGATIPGRITVQAGPDAPPQATHVAVIPTLDGAATLFLAPGTWTLTGSRGPQWGLCHGDVTVAAGEVGTFTCAIAPQIPADGWVSGDLHVHSEFSIDSNMPREERVKALIAEGLQFFAGTEHDVFVDYRPIVESMGAADLLTASLGNEVSPINSHFNCLGCTFDEGTYFEVAWMELSPEGEVLRRLEAPEIWALMHEDFGATMVQINHPRVGQGFFDLVGYDPETGPEAMDPVVFDMTFDSMEVWNAGEKWGHLRDQTLPDWYSFLNRGYRKIGVGNSDSHGLRQWAGQPRNLVLAEASTDEAFYGALKAGRSQVTSAPFIEFTAGDAVLGDTVVPGTPEAPVTFSIRVTAPTWAPLATVRLVGNGAVVQEWDVSGETGLLRLDVETPVAPPHDAWYHVIAFSEAGDLAPLYPGRASMAFTNPIWVDRDGDGFDPPLP